MIFKIRIQSFEVLPQQPQRPSRSERRRWFVLGFSPTIGTGSIAVGKALGLVVMGRRLPARSVLVLLRSTWGVGLVSGLRLFRRGNPTTRVSPLPFLFSGFPSIGRSLGLCTPGTGGTGGVLGVDRIFNGGGGGGSGFVNLQEGGYVHGVAV